MSNYLFWNYWKVSLLSWHNCICFLFLQQCKHYSSVRKINTPASYPLNKAEQVIINLTETKRPFMIPNTIKLNVIPRGNDSVLPLPKQTCYQRKNSESIKDTDVSGFFYDNNTWRPLSCRLPKVDKPFVRKCLINTTM